VQPTLAVAAVDVVRVKLLTGSLADIRVGHMEAAVSVPTGGVQCPGVTVTHTVDNPSVTQGQDFTYTIVVTNPNDCDLADLKVTETLTAPPGVKFTLGSTSPPGGTLSGDTVTWSNLGALATGASKTLTVKLNVPADSAGGKLTALAVATGVCPAKPQPTTAEPPPSGTRNPDDIPVTGQASVDGPQVGNCVVPDLKGKTIEQATAALEAAGCKLGTVTDGGPGKPADTGHVVNQGPPAGTTVPTGTTVDITVGGPLCTVPSLAGMTLDQARSSLQAAGCDLGKVTTDTTGNPSDAGKITTQTVPPGSKVPRRTHVDVVVGPRSAEVASAASTGGSGTGLEGQNLNGQSNTGQPAQSSALPATLARTGGVALAGLALWLLVSGLLAQVASKQLWRRIRRSGR
jgi:uncharacterized repeat protein (TIGR01451 family)